MKLINFSEGNSLINQFVAEMREVHIRETVCASEKYRAYRGVDGLRNQ